MQIERLVHMVFYIINHKQVTARELADYFHVSARTIYRDINALSLAGIPVISTKGTGGGISLLDGYTLDKALFSREEQEHLFQSLQALQAVNYPSAEQALSKLGAVFGRVSGTGWLDIDFSYWGSGEKRKKELLELQYAVIHKHAIAFDYFNSELKKSKRVIEPLQLAFKSHTWYVAGFCRSRKEIRIFRMSRMKHIRVMSETFERLLPAGFSISPDCREDCALPVFKLKFAPEIAYRLYDDFPESQIEAYADGSFIVTFPYEMTDWTFRYLLSFGRYVEILEPKAARSMLKEQALEIAGIYGEPESS